MVFGIRKKYPFDRSGARGNDGLGENVDNFIEIGKMAKIWGRS
jgi:hypothetical protein